MKARPILKPQDLLNLKFGKVLITGSGGSIGSALCKAIHADCLVLYELSEYALYQVDESLDCNRIAVLGDVRDESRLSQFMDGVSTVFHCAAYKHVPLLEGINASVAFKNNVGGTRSVLNMSRDVKTFVLLSTDKAVNPKSIMGRSKLASERLAIHYGRTIARLGNVVDSSGSVIPKFRKQIEAGGPVTITHPDATRYFITMDKAVDFILATAMRKPGTYQADMGNPVRIVDLAMSMIGDKDIKIEFTGLRPGEKLHEELEVAA